MFKHERGEGSDLIDGFRADSTISVAGGELTSATSGDDVIITIDGDNITLKGAGTLSTVNVVYEYKETPINIVNDDDEVSIVGTASDDTINNNGENVTITALDGNDNIENKKDNVTIDGGAGNDSIVNKFGFYSSIAGGAGNDSITVSNSSQVTINAGAGNDAINLSANDETFIEYAAGDGNDTIYGFDETATLNIAKSEFTSAIRGDDIILTVGANKITVDGAASLSNPNIVSGTYATFTIKGSKVTCDTDIPDSVIKDAYQFNDKLSLLTINDALKNRSVTVKNDEDSSVKVNLNIGSANLNSGSTLKYQLDEDKKNSLTLISKNYDDQITFSEDTNFNCGRIQAEVLANSTVSTKDIRRISFENDSNANVTAPRDYQIDVVASNILVNDLPVNAKNGAGTITVERRGFSFEGYGAQVVDVELAKNSYFGKLAPMSITYDSSEEVYTVYNTA